MTREKPTTGSSITFDEFVFDLDEGVLVKDGRTLKLHPQPAKLLALLVGNPGDVITREAIQESLWDDETHVDFNLGINSCVRQIRTALNDDAEKPRYLETVPKKGYRFIAPVEVVADVAKPSRSPRWVVPAGLVAVLLGALYFALHRDNGPTEPDDGRHSMAVLPFDNLTKDPDFDWLRAGLPELLVTDLSQSDGLRVSSTGEVVRILEDLAPSDDGVVSLEVVQELAEKARADTVVTGSFAESGDDLRIQIKAQDPTSGEILLAAKAEGIGSSSIFPLIDDLASQIRRRFEPTMEAGEGRMDVSLAELTTSSAEAYRYYLEGNKLLRRGEFKPALALYEKALEEDPDFGMVVANLALTNWNLGRVQEAERYAEQAIAVVDRMPPSERYAIEAYYYGRKETTFGRSIEALRQRLELQPDVGPPRFLLGNRYFRLENMEGAIEHWEILRARQHRGIYPYTGLARAHAALGRFDEGYDALQDALELFPENPTLHYYIGDFFAQWGRYDEALEVLDRGDSLGPGTLRLESARWMVYILREEWENAEKAARKQIASSAPNWNAGGRMRLARTRLYLGKSVDVFDSPILIDRAEVLLALGRAEETLEPARELQRVSEGNTGEWRGIEMEALALAELGQWEEAREAAERLRVRTESIPSRKENRRYHRLLGTLALIQGDSKTAIEELETAQSMLLPRTGGDHVVTWFVLARAYLQAGDEDQAAKWFRQVTESTYEHVTVPIPYVRSFYFLGQIHESRGDLERARYHYARFFEYWKDGDLDRDRVEEAKRKIESLEERS